MLVGVLPGLGPHDGYRGASSADFRHGPRFRAIIMLARHFTTGAMYGGTITSVLINTPGEGGFGLLPAWTVTRWRSKAGPVPPWGSPG